MPRSRPGNSGTRESPRRLRRFGAEPGTGGFVRGTILSSQSAMISIRGLTKRFGSTVAVDRASCEVAKGEVFGLLGPDGAGKTTLLRMLCGVLLQDVGTARVAGADAMADADEVKTRIGYMPQSFALYGDL